MNENKYKNSDLLSDKFNEYFVVFGSEFWVYTQKWKNLIPKLKIQTEYSKILSINLRLKLIKIEIYTQILSINFDFFLIFKIDTQIHTQKLNFFFILNYLIRNLQEICKILKLKTQILKKLISQTQTQT